ncbi:hypothetical protein EVG20_g62 [Dentipellis fragilis]|uniref:HD domain-containing protein n=1 Tax=Dentipellis fragilis TaxID=205917 RepID=A0A4Y9ZGH8_9AGAM|nr:hypothetical protein EVG20_g62 [Dentipellis fragilis]
MSFPETVDAYVPRDIVPFLQHSTIQPTYVPLSTLRSISLDDTLLASRIYATRITEPTLYAHAERCYLFSLAILANGFPSNTPGVPQIPFAELHTRLFHTTILHDLGLTYAPEALEHPARAMSFEIHGGMLAYEHLRRLDPEIAPERLGDVVQSIMTHTLVLPQGKTTAGGNATAATVREIMEVYPRGEQSAQISAFVGTMLEDKPHCLIGAGLPGFNKRVAAVKELIPKANE